MDKTLTINKNARNKTVQYTEKGQEREKRL